jgi:hypothetical protein
MVSRRTISSPRMSVDGNEAAKQHGHDEDQDAERTIVESSLSIPDPGS